MAAAIDAVHRRADRSATAAQGGLLAAIRVGIGKVQAAGYQPERGRLEPGRLRRARHRRDGQHRQRVRSSSASFWGMRAVAAGAIPAGKAYVGDFQAGATLFDRGVTSRVRVRQSRVAVHLATFW